MAANEKSTLEGAMSGRMLRIRHHDVAVDSQQLRIKATMESP